MPDFINASSAADLLGVDKRTVLRMARSGKLRSFRTPGGQHRFRREDVERLRSGSSGTADSAPPLSTVQNKREEVESLNLEVEARRAKRELARIESEDEDTERQKYETRRAETLANKRALAEIRAKEERERRESGAARVREAELRQAAHAREAAELERRAWVSETIMEALLSLPRDVSPEARATASEMLREALTSLDPDDPRRIVEIAVSGAIAKALAPSRRSKEIEQAIAEAENSLPFQIRSLFEPSDWQIRYRASADAAIRSLSADVPISQVRAAAQGEARKLAAEYECGEAQERHARACERIVQGSFLSGGIREEQAAATQAVKAALGKLPVGTSQTEMCGVRDAALVPFQAKIRAAEDADRYLAHVREYVEELGNEERGEWDLGDAIERSRFAERLRKRIRPSLVQAILSTDVQDEEQAQEFIENVVDSELEETE